MKTKTELVIAVTLVWAGIAVAQSTNPPAGGDQQRDQTQLREQDRLQTCDPTLERDRTRLRECLPDEVKQAVQETAKTRERYQQQLRLCKKELALCTDQERDQLRQQLRDQAREQARERTRRGGE